MVTKKKILAYLELTKSDIVFLVVLTTAFGYALGAQDSFSFIFFFIPYLALL